ETIAIGYDSYGPVLCSFKPGNVGIGSGLQFADLNLKPAPIRWTQNASGSPAFPHASADGSLFAFRDGVGGEPHGVHVVSLSGISAKVVTAGMSSSTLVPSPDARFIYCGSGVYNTELRLLYPEK